jgi:hypothetical protein
MIMLLTLYVFAMKLRWGGGGRTMVELLANEKLQGKMVKIQPGERELTINYDYVELSCYYSAGTIIEREVNCNSQFMLQILSEIA